eukprot:scaffold407_cov251-Pinguiococcus_pyrenoidosus.AAC.10
MIAPDHAGTQELVDARLRPAIEVPTNHYWKTPTEDEVLQFLRQCEGLPQLHVREVLVAVQMGIGNAQLHRRGQLPLMRRREKLQNRDLRDVVLHQPGEEGVLFSIGKVEGLGLSIRRLVELDGIVLAEAEAAPPPEGGAAVDFAGGAHGFPGLLLVDALEPHVAEQRAPVLFVVICLNLLQADDVRPRVADFPQEVLPAVLPRERPIVAVGIRLLGGVDLRKHVVRDHPHALPGAVVDPRHGQQLPLRNRRWHGEHRLGPDDLRAVEVLPVRLPDGADLHSQTASDIHLRGNVGTVRAHELPALRSEAKRARALVQATNAASLSDGRPNPPTSSSSRPSSASSSIALSTGERDFRSSLEAFADAQSTAWRFRCSGHAARKQSAPQNVRAQRGWWSLRQGTHCRV